MYVDIFNEEDLKINKYSIDTELGLMNKLALFTIVNIVVYS